MPQRKHCSLWAMAHANLPIFIPHNGCPNMCSFCNQRVISGAAHQPTPDEVRRLCEAALETNLPKDSEIAFFGGSFTAIDRDYMLSLLEAVRPFIGDSFSGIRISTRPDRIDRDCLELLKKYNVKAIELGAQSMSQRVLDANRRGHSPEDVLRASGLIRSYGFELGLQLMVGLYRSTISDEYETMRKIADAEPDTVRIYPVVVLRGTELAELYFSGEYKPGDFDRCVDLCADMTEYFEARGIRILRCGLHSSENVVSDAVAGFYHPAFMELCRSRLYRRKIEAALITQLTNNPQLREYSVYVNPRLYSQAIGQKGVNRDYFDRLKINNTEIHAVILRNDKINDDSVIIKY